MGVRAVGRVFFFCAPATVEDGNSIHAQQIGADGREA